MFTVCINLQFGLFFIDKGSQSIRAAVLYYSFNGPACHCNIREPNMISGSLLEPSLRLSCVYIFIPWPSLGDLAPPVSSRCPTWRSRGADLSLFLSMFSWFQRRFFRKVSFKCACYASDAELLLPRLKPGEYRGEVVVRLRAKMRTSSPLNLSITFICSRYRNIFDVFFSPKNIRVLISWFQCWLMGCCPELECCKRTAVKSSVRAAQLGWGEEKVLPVKTEWNARTVLRSTGQVGSDALVETCLAVIKRERFSGQEKKTAPASLYTA